MITAKSIRIFVLCQWSAGIVLALIFNRLWPPAAILFWVLTMTASILGFAAPVVNRLNYRNDLYTQVSIMDISLYLVLLTFPPILDTLIPGLLCPYTTVRGVWFLSLMALLFMLPSKWYDRYREFEKRHRKNALEAYKKKETVISIFRVAFIGGEQYFETMSSRRRWIYIISIISFCVTIVAVMGTMWIAVMAQFVDWLPIFAIPFASVGIFAAIIAMGVMSIMMAAAF